VPPHIAPARTTVVWTQPAGRLAGAPRHGANILPPGNPKLQSLPCAARLTPARPLGPPDFVAALEKSTSRLLAPRKGGRPPKPTFASRQSKLALIA
jgi:hypothetical protein